MSPSHAAKVAPLPYDGVRAPDFPTDLPWLNTAEPLSLRALRGKVVLLDFWTHGCINCLHILPDLRKLEAKYQSKLVVIAVHSAKFTTEADTKSVRSAVLRHKIEHPILVDQKGKVWSDYAIKAWPTLVLIDPNGRIAGQVAGEGHFLALDATIAELAAKARARGELSEVPLPLALERARVAPAPLSFPGKVLAEGETLYIADSGHNRLVKASRTGMVEAVVGSGEAGLKDGSSESAQFRNPQGMALDGDKLYVADTDNHALRLVDFGTDTVSTLAGNGQQASYLATGGEGCKARLSSPWDVLKVDDTLFIAMAGNHQIWKYEILSKKVSLLAGSGAEGRHDGSFENAAFAQPSGLAFYSDKILVADAESSCIRQLDLQTETVTTIAGGDLFDFGDIDGRGDEVRFQHPLGIARSESGVYIADTYNSKIKLLDAKTGEVETIFAMGLNEPGGLALDSGFLYVADSNNGVVKSFELATKEVETLRFAGLEPPLIAITRDEEEIVSSGTSVLAPDAIGTLLFEARLPHGFHLNRAAPLRLIVKIAGQGLEFERTHISGNEFVLPLKLPFQSGTCGIGTVGIDALISYCSSGQGAVCKVERVLRRFDFEIEVGGASELRVVELLP